MGFQFISVAGTPVVDNETIEINSSGQLANKNLKLLASITFDNTATSELINISGYNSYKLVMNKIKSGGNLGLRINGVSGTAYENLYLAGTTVTNSVNQGQALIGFGASSESGEVIITGSSLSYLHMAMKTGYTNPRPLASIFYPGSATTVSSLTIVSLTGNLISGSVDIYGVV